MLRSEICCSRSDVGCRCRGSGLPAQHSLGGLKALEGREQRGSSCQRPGLAIRRPNAIEHASREFRVGLDADVRRVERLVAAAQRDSHNGNSRKYVALTTQRSKSPRFAPGAFSTRAVGCPRASEPQTQHSSERNIGRQSDRALVAGCEDGCDRARDRRLLRVRLRASRGGARLRGLEILVALPLVRCSPLWLFLSRVISPIRPRIRWCSIVRLRWLLGR
jgi:hypothetical protein